MSTSVEEDQSAPRRHEFAAPYPAPDASARAEEPVLVGPPAAPAPVVRRRRGRFIAILVIAGILLLGGGFGAGFAVARATAPASDGFDPSRMGGPGGPGGFGGPGTQGDTQGDTGTGTGTAS